jgi:WD domain, G-beta repeat
MPGKLADVPLCRVNPLASQDSSLTTRAGAEIAALDINHQRTHAILAGREVLETIRVAGTTFAEGLNIRNAILNRDSQNPPRHRETLDIHDVKWSHGQFHTYIAAAATNGKVAVYDLGRPGIEVARLHEHQRQVHRVAFNPFQGHLLLSGSQDGTVRLWDLRDTQTEALTCRSRSRFTGQSEAIRDVRWSPRDGFEFALGTDSGVIQRWDYRNNKSPKLRINAHEKTCTTIDWHPDGKHLLSAGLDKMVKVWDFSTETRRQNASRYLRTPYPVKNARWRPPCWTNDSQGRGNWQCTQLATSYERIHPAVHIWDFRRSYMPFREIDSWTTAPTDMLWHSQDLLWSVSREGTFHQTDVQYAPKVIDRRPMQALAFSPNGELVVFGQKRSRRRRSELDYAQDDTSDGKGARPLAEKAGLSRSSFDDSVDESFLSSSHKRHHGRTGSNRSAKSLSSTPPSHQEAGVTAFDDTLGKNTEAFMPRQVAFRGLLDGTIVSLNFVYLAKKYKTSVFKAPPTVDALLNCGRAFEQNALYAQKTGGYRQAQEWRMYGSVVSSLVTRSAMEAWNDIEDEIEQEQPKKVLVEDLEQGVSVRSGERASTPVNPALRAIQGSGLQGQKTPESTSNVATPLARPLRITWSSSSNKATDLPNPDSEEQINLPPPVVSHRLDGAGDIDFRAFGGPVRQSQFDQGRPLFDGPHWLSSAIGRNLEERKSVMGNWRAPPRPPLDFDSPRQQHPSATSIPPPLDRHNSDESFGLLSQSSSSTKAGSMAASFSSRRSFSDDMATIPEDRIALAVRLPERDSSDDNIQYRHQSWGSYSATTSYPTNSSVGATDPMASGTIVPDSELDSDAFNELNLKGEMFRKRSLASSAIQLLQNFRRKSQEDDTNYPNRRRKHLWLTQPIWDLSVPEMLDHTLDFYTTQVPNPVVCATLVALLQSISSPCESNRLSALHTYIQHSDFIRTPPLKLQAIWATYLDLLQAHGLFSIAAKARNYSLDFDRPPTTTIRVVCETCGSMLPEPPKPPICSTCKARRAPCSICWSSAPTNKSQQQKRRTFRPPYLPGASGLIDSYNKEGLWLFCTACGHGAHFGCRQLLLEQDPETGRLCPVEACGCPCLQSAAGSPTSNRQSPPLVVRDDGERRARESRAVKGAGRILEKETKKVEFAGIA